MYLNDRSVINRIRLADNLPSSPRPICVEPSRSTVRSANHSGPCRLGNQWNSIRVQVTTRGGCCGLAVRQTNRYPITRAIRQVHPTRSSTIRDHDRFHPACPRLHSVPFYFSFEMLFHLGKRAFPSHRIKLKEYGETVFDQ